MSRWINLDAICEILEEDIKTGDELVNISWVRSWLLSQSKIIIPDSVEALYNVDRRKAPDAAKEILAEIEKEIELALDNNYKVKRDAQDMNDTLVIYVEGKIDCLRGLLGFIAELEKEYTEREGGVKQ